MRVNERAVQPVDAVRAFVMAMFGNCLLVTGNIIALRPSQLTYYFKESLPLSLALRTSHQFKGGHQPVHRG